MCRWGLFVFKLLRLGVIPWDTKLYLLDFIMQRPPSNLHGLISHVVLVKGGDGTRLQARDQAPQPSGERALSMALRVEELRRGEFKFGGGLAEMTSERRTHSSSIVTPARTLQSPSPQQQQQQHRHRHRNQASLTAPSPPSPPPSAPQQQRHQQHDHASVNVAIATTTCTPVTTSPPPWSHWCSRRHHRPSRAFPIILVRTAAG